jgi:hypothetical protein
MPERQNKIMPQITGYERCYTEGRTYKEVQNQTWLLRILKECKKEKDEEKVEKNILVRMTDDIQ